ncbi:hypothetical protein A2814_03175 [Candidatus Nomurabacteria bacterium RIFCSPHIGHO2_01_FULL_38_19]|uniref:Kinase inhibitor n=1 Tax=Candidatus Nomurabacteria bacterium RIFCSPHIGHO2_01_FULL_38_19 TaxID=1801732 RepID=A0A1F6UQA1_9BACT|nr:MAG: hypothetical protein A2814_03175 [Candidatus Nomurabacteria bacterium RIFCSPHIGHO2_01_FULL_38_19]
MKKIIFLIIVLLVALTLIFKMTNKENNMNLTSEIFANNGKIPVEYTCNGKGIQPPLKISGVPEEAKSLALIVDDLDAPNGDFVHWVVWNLDPKTPTIENGIVPEVAVEGYTSLNKSGWIAPCPPSGVHHYNFKLYALDTVFSIPNSGTKADLILAMDKHIIDNVTLIGLYGKDF